MFFPNASAKETSRATYPNFPVSAQPRDHLRMTSEDQGKGRRRDTLRGTTCLQQGCTPPRRDPGWQTHRREQWQVRLANVSRLGGEMSLPRGQLPILSCTCPAESCIEPAKAYNVVRQV